MRDVCDLAHAVQYDRAERLILAAVAGGDLDAHEAHERLAQFEASLIGDVAVGPQDELIARIRRQVEEEAA